VSGLETIRPTSEAEVQDALRAAREESARLVPVGRGHRVGALRPDAADARRLDVTGLVPAGSSGVIEYVPGDGVVTAHAGAAIEGIAAAVREGGHRLTPRLGASRTADGATLGGLVGEGRSGLDRVAFGPLRHHVLGLRIVDGRGRAVRSGGRLVKNVTGFDLHRLVIGARGAMGVALEVSLRLVPAAELERTLLRDTDGPAEALSLARSLRADARIHARALFTRGGRVTLVLGGRGAEVEAETALAREVAGPFDSVEDGEDASQRAVDAGDVEAALRVTTRPSRASAALEALAACGADVSAATLQPDAAEIALSEEALAGAADDLGARIAAAGAVARALSPAAARLLASAPHRAAGAAGLEDRVQAALDPDGVLRAAQNTVPTAGGAAS